MLRGALLVAIAVVLLPECEANAGTTQHPPVNKYILEHSLEMIMPNISSYSKTIALRKKNHSSSDWYDILSIRKGKLTHFRTEYKAHFSVLENGLVVVNFSKILIGEYQLVGQLNQNLLLHIFLHILDVTQCPPVNSYTLGSSSQTIQPNISSYPKAIALRKKNHTSSDWNYILSIRNGELRYYLTEYMAHFSVLENDFVVGNSSKILTEEYQLVDQHTGKCLQHFFIIPDSKPRHHGGAICGVVFALVIVLAVPLSLWLKRRRGRSAHPSTGAPGLGNELLRSTAVETNGTTVNLLSEESGTVANGMA